MKFACYAGPFWSYFLRSTASYTIPYLKAPLREHFLFSKANSNFYRIAVSFHGRKYNKLCRSGNINVINNLLTFS